MIAFDARYMEHARHYAAQPFWFYEVGKLMHATRPWCQGGRVLDVGCNDGSMAFIVHRFCHARSVSGIDVNEAAIVHGSERWPELDLAWVHDGESYPYPSCEFDVVLSLNAVGHMADPRHAASEMRRVLVPSGRLAVVVPNHRYYQVRDLAASGPRGDLTQRWQYGRASLSDLFAGVGITVDKVSSFGRHPRLMPWLRSRLLLEGHRS